MKRDPLFLVVVILLLIAALWLVFELQWHRPVSWDEVEFFRATRWTGEGRVPYRDFWEHHTPLQWIAFAPIARWFGGGAGVQAVLAMRWAQLPLFAATFFIVLALMRRCRIGALARGAALLLLACSSVYALSAIEYRVDTFANFLFVAGIACAMSDRPWKWIGFGVLLSLAVLANMRLAPLTIVAGIAALFWNKAEERWRWNRDALWMFGGVGAVAAALGTWLFATRSTAAFIGGVIHYNTLANRLVSSSKTLIPTLLLPFTARDLAGIALCAAGIAGAVMALRRLKTPGALQFLAVLAAASIVAFAMLGVQYTYHLGTSFILLTPLAGWLLDRSRAFVRVGVTMAAGALVLGAIPLLSSGMREPLLYQDRIMREADAHTAKSDHVWDGCGYALRREPAYRYWFLPSGVRLMAQRGLIPRYGEREMSARPPAAIVYNLRVHYWLKAFPDAKRFVVQHYVPVYRNLWMPGTSGVVSARMSVVRAVSAHGRYRVYASPLLLKHPWFSRPLEMGLIDGPDAPLFKIPLSRVGAQITMLVNGAPVDVNRAVELGPEDAIEFRAPTVERRALSPPKLARQPAGFFLVPEWADELFIAPGERYLP